jgi:hypothetical protein
MECTSFDNDHLTPDIVPIEPRRISVSGESTPGPRRIRIDRRRRRVWKAPLFTLSVGRLRTKAKNKRESRTRTQPAQPGRASRASAGEGPCFLHTSSQFPKMLRTDHHGPRTGLGQQPGNLVLRSCQAKTSHHSINVDQQVSRSWLFWSSHPRVRKRQQG